MQTCATLRKAATALATQSHPATAKVVVQVTRVTASGLVEESDTVGAALGSHALTPIMKKNSHVKAQEEKEEAPAVDVQGGVVHRTIGGSMAQDAGVAVEAAV